MTVKLVVIGASQGGLEALSVVLGALPYDFAAPILVVRHQAADASNYVVQALSDDCQMAVKMAQANDQVVSGTVYLAPPDRHLLVTGRGRLGLSDGVKIKYSRPAINPLFTSAAKIYGQGVLAVMLTGANDDGTQGLLDVQAQGGIIVVQDPASAEAKAMPLAALSATTPDYVVELSQIGPLLWDLVRA